jgi:hypothetical protein
MDERSLKDRAFSEDGSWFGISDGEESVVPARRASFVDEAEKRYFGQSENRKVRNLKALVVLVLFVVTLAVCLVIYFLTAAGQQQEFEAS